MDIFASTYVDSITIERYVQRIHKYGPMDDQSDDVYLVVGLIYIDRFLFSRGTTLHTMNVHRIWLVAYLLAIKFLEDRHFDNRWFASVGGIPLLELNILEAEFLRTIQFDLRVDTYMDYIQQLTRVTKG